MYYGLRRSMIVAKNERITIQWVRGENKLKIHERRKNKRTKGNMEVNFLLYDRLIQF